MYIKNLYSLDNNMDKVLVKNLANFYYLSLTYY